MASDNFDSYADASSLADAANWDLADGISTCIKINKPASDGEVYPSSSDDSCVYYTGSFSADQFSQATVTSTTGSVWIGPAVRCSTTSNGTYYAWCGDDNDSYLVKRYADALTYPIAGDGFAVNDVIKLQIEGSTLKFYKNGSLDTSMSVDGMYDDSDITSGNPGFGSYGISTSARLDDWEGGDLSTYDGTLYVYNGSVWVKVPLKEYEGSFDARPVRYWNGSAWKLVMSF